MSSELSKLTVCFCDNGLFHAFARRIAPAFKKAYYYIPWQKAFVRSRELTVGMGYPELERVRSPFIHGDIDLLEEVDLYVFLDQFMPDIQWLLQTKYNKRVFGARFAEELELYRWQARDLFKRLGLPVLPAEQLQGMDSLRSYLKANKDKYVKTSFNTGGRADFETFHHQDYAISEPRLDQLQYDLGPLHKVYEFIVESSYPDAVEIGYDGYTVDGRWPGQAMQAFEIKGLFMAGTIKPYQQLAEPVRRVNQALAPVLGEYGYRGFLSTEIRWGKERKPYLLDPCCRLGSPSNELLQELILNWPEILWEGAAGNLVEPKVSARFAVCAMVYSEQSANQWTALAYPKEIDQWVKVRNPARIAGKTYSVPMGAPQNVAAVVGTGNSLLEAIKAMAERAKAVKGDRIQIETEAAQKALQVIEQGHKYGIQFTQSALPSVSQLQSAVA